MIRRYAALLSVMLAAADVVLAAAVLWWATNIRFGRTSGWPADVRASVPDPNVAAAAFITMWIVVLWMHGLYRSRVRWTRRSDVYAVLRATIVQLVATLSLLYLLKLPDVSRMLLVLIFPSIAVSALAIRIALRQVLMFVRDHGRNVRYLLILGASGRARAFAELVENHPELGLVVIGHLKADAADGGVILDKPVLGMMDDLESVLHSQIVDEVAICLPFSMEEMIEQAAYLCEQEGKVVRIPLAPVERVITSGRLENVDGVGIYSIANGADRVFGLFVKRFVDMIGAAFAIVVLSPALLLLALLVRLDSPGGVFFRQERVGLHGRPFYVVKFRSMVEGAEEQLDDLLHRNEIKGQAFKLSADPRITRFGAFLRRTSLDELPQLFNVIRGEMSLVGPRPPLPREVADYDVWHRRRLSMKPGMTGLWQIGARRSQEFDHWVEQDLEYIDTWSLWLDFKIMAKTLPAVLSGTGR